MKKWMKLVVVIAVFSVILVTGCKDDTADPDIEGFEILAQYMVDNGLDLPAMLSGGGIPNADSEYKWVVSAADLVAFGLDNAFIIDIRKGDKYGPDGTGAWPVDPTPNNVTDYEDGHIEDAHSVALADVVTYEAANNVDNLPVVVACYTGHDAGHAVMALRLSGVTDAQSLKWGMSGWNDVFDLWTSHTGNVADDYPGSWIDDDLTPALPSYTDIPEFDTDLEDGAEILAERINNAVLDGLNGIINTDVLSDYDSYDIYCYWGEADWNNYGHITSSYQVTPGELDIEKLDMLNPVGVNVIYCWSGQTASMIAAWLHVLGIDGRTLKFSSNGMIYDTLTAGKWIASEDFDYIVGP